MCRARRIWIATILILIGLNPNIGCGRDFVCSAEGHADPIGPIIVFTNITVITPPGWTGGLKNVLLMRVAFSDDHSEPISQSAATELMSQVNAFFVQSSYGSVSLATTVSPLLILPETKEWYRTNSAAHEAVLSDARMVAKGAGFDTANFELDAVVFNQIYTAFSGTAKIGAKGVWLQNPTVGNACHEFGHNFGLFHANSWSALGDSIIGPGSNLEYGNVFDTMGVSARNGQFNACHKNRLGWLPAAAVQSVTASGIYTISPFDVSSLTSSSKYAIKIKKDSLRDYWLEARRGITNSSALRDGILINWSPWAQSNGGSQLLDMTPGSPAQRDDAPLAIGRTFADKTNGIYITPLGHNLTNAEAMDVAINIGTFGGNHFPSATLVAPLTSTAPGISLAFNVTAFDLDLDRLAYYWDFGDGSPGTNSPVVTKVWSREGEFVVSCSVSDMKGGTATVSTVVRVGNPSTSRITGRAVFATRGLEGVRISASGGGVAYTDSAGDFTLTGLTPGSFVISAAKAGYVFTPNSQILNLGATNLAAQNFIAQITSNLNNTPMVTLARPSANDTFASSGVVTLEALVDDDSLADTVRFFANGSLIGTVATSPYQFSLANSQPGSYSLSATVVDDGGLASASPPVNITIVSAPPANDSFSAPIQLNGLFTSVTGENVAATKESGEPNHARFFGGRSVWYSWTPAIDCASVLTVSGQIRNSLLAVYRGTSVDTLTAVVSQFAVSTNQLSFAALAGTNYRIAVDDALNTPGSFTLGLVTGIAPSITMTSTLTNGSVLSPGVNIPLQVSAADSDGFVASVDVLNGGRVLATLTNTSFNFTLPNITVGSYQLTARARDNIGATTSSTLLSFRVPPSNDNFAKAIMMNGDTAAISGTNDGAGSEPGEPGFPPYIGGRSVWYSWKASRDTDVVLRLAGEIQNTLLGVFQGGNVSNLVTVASQYSLQTNELTFRAIAGAVYYIAVDDAGNSSGSFVLSLISEIAPTVSLGCNTQSGSVLSPGASIELTANAADADGTISSVDLFNGTTLIATLVTPPYSFAIVNLAVGSYQFVAQAHDNVGGSTKSGPFLIRVPPPNDDFANRILLTGLSASIAGTNAGASKEAGEPNHAGFAGGRSVWYSWTAPANLGAVLSLSGSISSSLIAVYRGESLLALTNVSSESSSDSGPTNRISFNAVAGANYQIAVDDSGNTPGNFNLALVTSAPPTVSLATVPSANSALSPGSSIQLFATASDPDGSVSRVEFFDGATFLGSSAFAPYTFVITNVQVGAYNLFARAIDNLGAVADSSIISLRAPASNDNFTNRISLDPSVSVIRGSNVGASKEAGEPIHANFEAVGRSVWYSFTSSTNTGVILEAQGTILYPILAVYTGNTLNSLTRVISSYTTNYASPVNLTFNAEAGISYQIAVDDAANTPGDFALSIVTTAPPLVSMASPYTNHAILPPGTNIPLEAFASDPDGSIAKVEFLDGTTVLATITNAPYQFTLTNAAYGSYLLSVRATDNLGASSNSIPILLRVPPPNDDFINRTTLNGTIFTVLGTNSGAATEPGEPRHAGQTGGASIWWSWLATEDGDVTVSTDGTMFDTLLGIYVGLGVSNLVVIASDDDGGINKASRLTFHAVAGTIYQIAVDGYSGASGTVRLNLFSANTLPRITSFSSSKSGFSLQVVGPGRQNATIEASADLVHWIPIATGTNGGVYLEAVDTNANQFNRRFYRTVWP